MDSTRSPRVRGLLRRFLLVPSVPALLLACSARAPQDGTPSAKEDPIAECDRYVAALSGCIARTATQSADALKRHRQELEARFAVAGLDDAARATLRDRCISAEQAIAKTCAGAGAEARR